MHGKVIPAQVEEACEDLKSRTLPPLQGHFGCLIYLASMRDYNTGCYYHEGLARRFSEEAAAQALAKCHLEAFQMLLKSALEEMVRELEQYGGSAPGALDQLLDTWERLQPYRVVVPAQTNPVLADFFSSNIKMALAILKHRRSKNS